MKQFKPNPLAMGAAGIAFFLGAVGCSFNAAAQSGPGVTVNDPVSIEKAVAEYAEQAKRWSDTLAQYQKEIAHYQQMIASIANLNFQSLLPKSSLQKITDASEITQQACPGSGSIASDLVSSVGLSLNGNIRQNQQKICQVTIQLKVQAYNDTIDMMDRLQKYGDQNQSVDSQRSRINGSSSSVGDMQANSNEAQRTANKLQAEMESYRAKMAAYDSAIKTLDARQSILANTALRGKSSLTGKAIQAATFAAAFSSH